MLIQTEKTQQPFEYTSDETSVKFSTELFSRIASQRSFGREIPFVSEIQPPVLLNTLQLREFF